MHGLGVGIDPGHAAKKHVQRRRGRALRTQERRQRITLCLVALQRRKLEAVETGHVAK
jgi:hypothetical protein